jgi:shikimate dehydrogenase
MQNAALRACHIAETEYVKNPRPPEKMEEMLAALRAEDCLGANVTVPHKQTILPHLDKLTELAREIGAVNTILKRTDADGHVKLIGDNTDTYGLVRALRERNVELNGMCVVILGAGGAAAAAAYALAGEGANEIVLLNRTLARSVELADRLHEKFPDLALAINDWDVLKRAHLVINATSVGMSPRAGESPLPENVVLAQGAFVFDLVYNPPATKFLHQAEARGARVLGGLDMLIYQGVRAFELWTGERAPIEVMRAAATEALQELMRTQSPEANP